MVIPRVFVPPDETLEYEAASPHAWRRSPDLSVLLGMMQSASHEEN